MAEKAALRARMRAVLASLPPEVAQREAEAVAAHVLRWSIYRQACTVMLYVPLPHELDTTPLLDAVLASGKVLALPRCTVSSTMDAVAISDWRALRAGRYGLREPMASLPALPPTALDLILTPGLAFDETGNRLGRGVGYYDRFLQTTTAVTAGLAFAAQIVPSLPTQAHDVALAYQITAQGICRATHQRGGNHNA